MTYIIVLNYRNSKDTIECLDSLYHLRDKDYKIVVVDNASNDGSEEQILAWEKKRQKDFVYLQSGANRGYAGGNNVGIRYALQQADMKYVWILNNDTVVDSEALGSLIKYMDENPRVGVCGSKLVYEWDRTRLQGYGCKINQAFAITRMVMNEAEIPDIDYVCGAAMFVRREFIEKIGLLSEEYFLYYEEPDWALRAKGQFSMGCAKESIVYHKEGVSIGASNSNKGEKSFFSDYFMVRSRILFTKKFSPHFLPLVYIGLLWTMINRIRRGKSDRIMMIIKLMFGIRDDRLEPKY